MDKVADISLYYLQEGTNLAHKINIPSIQNNCINNAEDNRDLRFQQYYLNKISWVYNDIKYSITQKKILDFLIFDEYIYLLKDKMIEIYDFTSKKVKTVFPPIFKTKEMVNGLKAPQPNNEGIWIVKPHKKEHKKLLGKTKTVIDTGVFECFLKIEKSVDIVVILSDIYTAREFQFLNTKTLTFSDKAEWAGIL